MGSIDKACISGFLCRLCSEMHRIVIHIYGDQGKRLCLVEKINGYLPITISPSDPLPKTICETCLRRVEQHYDLLMRLSRIKEERILHKVKKPLHELLDITSSENSDEDDFFNNDDEPRRRNNLQTQTRENASATSSESTTHTHATASNAISASGRPEILPSTSGSSFASYPSSSSSATASTTTTTTTTPPIYFTSPSRSQHTLDHND